MVTQTFFNLKPDRQEEILQVAFQEFALKGYQAASLSEIIRRLALAKGSFYRYFDSKKSLFGYLLEEATKRRLSSLKALIDDDRMDFFSLLKMNFRNKIEFDVRYPVIGGFLYRIMHEKDQTEVSDIIREHYNTLIDQTRLILSLPQYKQQLHYPDALFAAFYVFHTQLWIYDYVAREYQVNFEENIRQGKPLFTISETETEKVLTWSGELLKNGMAKIRDHSP